MERANILVTIKRVDELVFFRNDSGVTGEDAQMRMSRR